MQLDRLHRGYDSFTEYSYSRIEGNRGLIKVTNRKSRESYEVDLHFGTCSCPDYCHRLVGTEMVCKHFAAVAMTPYGNDV